MSGIINQTGARSGVIGTTEATASDSAVIAYKVAVMAVTGSNYYATSSTTWVGTSSDLNITYAMTNASNMLIFTLSQGDSWVPTNATLYFNGVGKTTDLTGNDANIIRYGGDYVGGRSIIRMGNTDRIGATAVFKYLPTNTTEYTYQPLQRTSVDASLGYGANNSDQNNTVFTLQEVVV